MKPETIRELAADPAKFQASLVIPSAHGPARFGSVMADFQRERFAQINPALVAVARGKKPATGRFWWEATKGASKDSDLAVCLVWLLAFSKRPLLCQVGAADQDQAAEMKKAAADVLRLNGWLAGRVLVNNWRLTCPATNATAEIVAADVAGSHGARPDVAIINELSHITKQEFAENLMDNAGKIPNGLAVIATNAGFLGTWQARWRQIASTSDRWACHVWDRPSPWLDPLEIEEAEQRNSQSRYRRLWWGVWASGSGDAIDMADIEAAITQSGPMTGREPNYLFVAGLDLGVRRDHSALVILGCHRASGRVRLAACQSWSPSRGREVDLQLVQSAVLAANRKYNVVRVGFDPSQALLMAQQLRRLGVRMQEVPFVGRNLNAMASTLLESFRSGILDLYRHPALIRDLMRLQIVEKAYGYKLESIRDDEGHADTATAFAIALPFANRRALAGCWTDAPRGFWVQPDVAACIGRFRRHERSSL